MLDCRYYDLCCFTDDSCNGEQECPKREHCQFYSPMPDVKELLALADEMELDGAGALDDGDWCKPLLIEYAHRIREALGVTGDAQLG